MEERRLSIHHADATIFVEVIKKQKFGPLAEEIIHTSGHKRKHQLKISTIAVGEIIKVIHQSLETDLDKEIAYETLSGFFERFNVGISSFSFKALKYLDEIFEADHYMKTKPMDAFIIATAINDGAEVLYSFDSDICQNISLKEISKKYKIKFKTLSE